MITLYSFSVPGRPVPKARPRVTRWGTYTPSQTRDYEKRVLDAWKEQQLPMLPAETPIRISVKAWIPLPMSMSQRRRLALNGTPHTGHRADVDNIVKSVCDALNGHAYPDDCAIWRIEGEKLHHNGEGMTDVVIIAGETPEAQE